MPQVQRIDPIVLPSEKETVAAYCRVSTNSEDQTNSYNTQIAYYTKRISENPDWELVDIYADRGISGTSMAKRDEFNRMLADCREGKIKRVLVKSVSRFARNTTELLQTTRELKDLGVVVVFEEQGYDTSQVLGEMQLAMYAIDLYKLLQVTDYAEVVSGNEISKLADHLDDFIVIKGAETYVDVGEYITQHEMAYAVGENMADFVNYSKLGEFIMQERDGQFMGGCFVCMEDGSDFAHIMSENRQEIDFGGM